MARIERPEKPGSQNAGAFVPKAAFAQAGVDPDDYPTFCERAGTDIRVKIAPAAYDYLDQLPEGDRDREIVNALPYAAANDRPRVWSTDFALAAGRRTHAEVDAWHEQHRIRVRSSGYGGLSTS